MNFLKQNFHEFLARCINPGGLYHAPFTWKTWIFSKMHQPRGSMWHAKRMKNVNFFTRKWFFLSEFFKWIFLFLVWVFWSEIFMNFKQDTSTPGGNATRYAHEIYEFFTRKWFFLDEFFLDNFYFLFEWFWFFLIGNFMNFKQDASTPGGNVMR